MYEQRCSPCCGVRLQLGLECQCDRVLQFYLIGFCIWCEELQIYNAVLQQWPNVDLFILLLLKFLLYFCFFIFLPYIGE